MDLPILKGSGGYNKCIVSAIRAHYVITYSNIELVQLVLLESLKNLTARINIMRMYSQIVYN